MNAQYNLGVCYLNGRGLAKDILVGIDWLQKSASQGNLESLSALEQLAL